MIDGEEEVLYLQRVENTVIVLGTPPDHFLSDVTPHGSSPSPLLYIVWQ